MVPCKATASYTVCLPRLKDDATEDSAKARKLFIAISF